VEMNSVTAQLVPSFAAHLRQIHALNDQQNMQKVAARAQDRMSLKVVHNGQVRPRGLILTAAARNTICVKHIPQRIRQRGRRCHAVSISLQSFLNSQG